MFWIGTTALVSAAAWSLFQYPEPIFLLPSHLLPKLDVLLWRHLHLKAYMCFSFSVLFLSLRELKPDCSFLSLSSFPILPSQPLTILLSCSSVSVQLSYSPALSGKVMKRHIRLLSGCTGSSKLCALELSSQEFFPRWNICPFTAGFKNTFGCFKH